MKQKNKKGLALHHFKNGEGMTIIETIVAMGIGVVVITMLMLIVTQGLGYIRKIQEQERLQANAVFITDKMSYWVRQGKELNSPTPDELRIVLPDDSEKVFEKNGNDITLDGNLLISDGVKVITLDFTALEHSVRVDFVLESKSGEVELPVTTTFAQRNL